MIPVIILCIIEAAMLAMGIYLIVISKQKDGIYFYDFKETGIAGYIILTITTLFIITTIMFL
jgi:hypothetical protein